MFPGGTGQTEMQVAAIARLQAGGYIGTPSFLRIILEKGDELDADVSSLKKALVSAEALPATLRAWLNARGVGDAAMLCHRRSRTDRVRVAPRRKA